MRYLLLATDYDGTLAKDGRVDEPTLAALERLRATGRRLVLVTGRELPELLEIFPQIHLFDLVVAENGALLYRPETKEERILHEPPPAELVETLQKRGVAPLSVGKVIIAGWKPHETTILEAIRDHALEMQVIFNKDAVMVLPSGVNKATGLEKALTELELSAHEVVGVGDAENDHAFLTMCACSAAVDNALQPLKDKADLVMKADHGAGVVELIDMLVKDDLQESASQLTRHDLVLGSTADEEIVSIKPFGSSVLIAGPSGSGKSTAATSILERLGEQKFQYCIVDPEGDYENLEGALTIGTTERGPSVEEVLQSLANPTQNVVINLLGLKLADRPPFFAKLLPHLLEMRSRVGRPHWILLDEVHHLLPAQWKPGPDLLPRKLERLLMITVHPDQIAADALTNVDTVIMVGNKPEETLSQFGKASGQKTPRVPKGIEPNKVVVWSREQGIRAIDLKPSKIEHRRHSRKYAVGEMPPEASFYFKGPEGKLNLRAQNLFLFLQIGEGIDDETWLYHLRAGDYSRWFSEFLKDDVLAKEAATIEEDQALDANESRQRLREVIEKHYTWPAAPPPPLPMPGTAAAPVH
jgi:hydroxymethylpyrimidine pyrophosphatase-like HAD family hydrolase